MISIINFNQADVRSRINSPRSIQVMKMRGITQDELYSITKEKV